MTDVAQGVQVAIVTGAGSGVGRDTAILLAEYGYAVVLVARTLNKLEETAAMIREEVGDAATTLVCPADVADESAVASVVKQTLERFGRIDAVANCAGDAPLQPIERIDAAVLDRTLAVNLKSVIYMTKAVWPTFRAQKSGAVVNVSSMASIDPFKGFNIYAAAKAGVNLFTKATADEGARLNIIAAAVAPGAIETPMLRANFPEKIIPASKALDPAVVAGVIRDVLTGRRAITSGETILLPSP